MKKIINAVDDVLTEALAGFGAAHADLVSVSLAPKFVTRRDGPRQGKVALVSGGGSGHEPLHAGFVGMGSLFQIWEPETLRRHKAEARARARERGLTLPLINAGGDGS